MLQLKEIQKEYQSGDLRQAALNKVTLNLRDSEFVAVLGPSGSGKTTLLNIIGGLDRYDSGDLIINGISTKQYSERDWDSYRNHSVGFVFQSYNLIPHQSVLANVELALTISGVPAAERRRRAIDALEKVGLGDQLHKRPSQMSGGQMQRVAIARALVNNPDILLADEPTGALDSETSLPVMELLKEVARDRLVVMVTHNPELAEHYANRIVQLRDGVVLSDTNPYFPDESTLAPPVHKSMGRASMSLLTALQLSLNNLLTKKTRTLLTAFAGSIGIIGIALIAALSNGVNNYVDDVERSMLTAYPLQISSSGMDITAFFSSGVVNQNSASDSDETAEEGTVTVYRYLTKMISGVAANDLKSFKNYLESGESTIPEDTAAIEYSYGAEPQIYRQESDGTVRQVNPDTTLSALGLGGASGTSSLNLMSSMSSMMDTSVFYALPEDTSLYLSQFEVKAGRWPENANECVVVLGKRGDVADYALYAMGLRDAAELDRIVKQYAQNQQIDVPTNFKTYSYSDFIDLKFKVINAADRYVYDETYGIWKDKSDDADFMQELVANGQDLTVVGVVRPIDSGVTPMLDSGIAYSAQLVPSLIEQAAASDIVQAQLASLDTNVLTGEAFGADEGTASLDFSSLISVDTDALAAAFSVDESALNFDLSGLEDLTANLDLASLIDLDSLSLSLPDASALDLSEVLQDLHVSVPSDQLDQLSQKVADGYKDYVIQTGIWHVSKIGFDAYLKSDAFKQLLRSSVQEMLASSELQSQVTQAMQTAVQNSLAGYSEQLAAALQSQLSGAMQTAMAQVEQQLEATVRQNLAQLSTQMENAVTIDSEALKNAVRTNLSEEELSELAKSMLLSSSSSYENNLSSFGYADLTTPTQISIYPLSFESKASIIAKLDAYNDAMEAQGAQDKAVQYTDIVGTLMSSVTEMIGMISTILIVMVSISLVVSSIMIGVITYISVLERSKEIGILRAIGASKRNVSHVFTAETFIIGLCSGLMGVGLSRLLLIPGNRLIRYIFANSNSTAEITAVLPWRVSLVLVALATLLTVLSGWWPSKSAAKCNPVAALRSE